MLESILKLVVDKKASDVHLKVGQPPVLRMPDGQLLAAQGEALNMERVEEIAKKITSEEKHKEYLENKQVDCAYSLEGAGRFRVNLCREKDGPAVAFRLIPSEIPEFPTLGLPEILSELALNPRGLLLVTGSTGSGKTTTLASLLDIV